MVSLDSSKITKDSTLFETRDQNLIVILVALRHEIKSYYKKNGIVTVCFDKENTRAHVEDFYGNHTIPLDDARMFIVASAIFRSMIKEAD